MILAKSDLPPLYQAADQTAVTAERRFLRATRVRLLAVIGASLFGLFTWKSGASPTDWSGVLAALCFAVVLLVEAYLVQTKPERTWYEARAAAESVKTLSWRYAVGGEPFNIGTGGGTDVSALFLARLRSLFDVVKDLDLEPPNSSEYQITQRMRDVRASDLSERKAIYETGRVGEQQDWYLRKARLSKRAADNWTFATLGIEVIGVVFAILKAVGVIRGDFLTFAGVVIAAIAAWLQAKQYRPLAAAYTVTALELATVRTKAVDQQTESEWSAFVSDAEEAFSREHTLWKASRVGGWR